MARDYELGIVISPDVGDEHARAIVDRVTQAVAANEGQVVRVNAWGRRRLAYPIEHHRDGLYFYFDVIMPPTSVAEVERSLRVNEDIIRHLLKSRDPRVVAQERQRDAENEVRAAEARAAAEAEAARVAAEQAEAAPVAQAETVPAEAAPAEATSVEATQAPDTSEQPVSATEPEAAPAEAVATPSETSETEA